MPGMENAFQPKSTDSTTRQKQHQTNSNGTSTVSPMKTMDTTHEQNENQKKSCWHKESTDKNRVRRIYVLANRFCNIRFDGCRFLLFPPCRSSFVSLFLSVLPRCAPCACISRAVKFTVLWDLIIFVVVAVCIFRSWSAHALHLIAFATSGMNAWCSERLAYR